MGIQRRRKRADPGRPCADVNLGSGAGRPFSIPGTWGGWMAWMILDVVSSPKPRKAETCGSAAALRVPSPAHGPGAAEPVDQTLR